MPLKRASLEPGLYGKSPVNAHALFLLFSPFRQYYSNAYNRRRSLGSTRAARRTFFSGLDIISKSLCTTPHIPCLGHS